MAEAFGGYAVEFKLDCPHILVGEIIHLVAVIPRSVFSKKCENIYFFVNPVTDNPTKWSNTLKQFVLYTQANCLSAFDHFVGLALKGLKFKDNVLKNCFREYTTN